MSKLDQIFRRLNEQNVKLLEIQGVSLSARDTVELIQKSISEEKWQDIEEIQMIDTDLSEVPEFVMKPNHLRYLMLAENLFKSITLSSKLGNDLVDLSLDNNPISKLEFDGASFKKLRYFFSSNHHFNQIPKALFELQEICEIDLSKGKIDSVDIPQASWKRLQKLDLRDNRIGRLTGDLENMVSLKVLDLGSNRLSELPESIGQLKSLVNFNLSGNRLTSLPESISQLQWMTALNICDNQIRHLPEHFGMLSSLTILHAKNNLLDSLPLSIGKMTWLDGVILSKNNFRSIPDVLSKIKGLRDISLDFNPVKSLSSWIYKRENLWLQLQNTEITVDAIKNSLVGVKKVENVTLFLKGTAAAQSSENLPKIAGLHYDFAK